MRREPVSWTTKDNTGIFGWSTLIYDSLRSAIPESRWGDLLGKDKRKGFDWPILIYDSPGSSITKGVTHILLG